MYMLNKIIPIDLISESLGKEIDSIELSIDSIREIQELTPNTCSQIGMNVWDNIIYKKLHNVQPRAIASYINNPKLHMRVGSIIGETVIKDIYYARGNVDDNLDDTQVFEFMVAHVYPNDLYLADILMQNPYSPIDKNDIKFELKKYHGFNLLPLIMKQLNNTAKELGCNKVSLTASSLDQVPLFKKYGFKVRGSESGKLALKYGLGIPMDKVVK